MNDPVAWVVFSTHAIVNEEISVMITNSAKRINFTSETKADNKDAVMEKPAEQPIDLEAAVGDHYKQVYKFALHLTRHAEDAADLTQHAYEILTKRHQEILDPSKVRSWLQSIVYRKFIDQKRRIIRFPQVEFNEEHDAHHSSNPNHTEQIDAKAALAALYELEDDLRAPLILFYLESNSYKDIAVVLELPVGTVMSRLYRGKAKLLNLLNGEKS